MGKLAKPSDGPYIYVAHNDAGERGPTALDRGTNYSGCKDDATGEITPEYVISITKLVSAKDCSPGSTFVPRNSTEALPAHVANTNKVCGGYEHKADSCVIKYHKFTGIPVWGAATVQVRAMEASEDGPLCVGSWRKDDTNVFAKAKLPSAGANVMFQSLIDKDTGVGVYVQSLSHPLGDTYADATAMDEAGNFYSIGRTQANELYGNSLNLKLPFSLA